MKNSEALSRDR